MKKITSNIRPLVGVLLLPCLLTIPATAQNMTIPPGATEEAREYLRGALADDAKLPVVLGGLRSTGDRDLLPLFESMMRSGEKELRLMATVTVSKVGGEDSAPALLERLRKDPAMVIRSEALMQLAMMKAITPEQLVEATRLDDEGVRIIAARALGRLGKGKLATEILEKLTASRDRDTAVFARMTLLGTGDRKQIQHLRKIILDPEIPQELLIRILNQVWQEKITDALDVAKFLTKKPNPMAVRIRAYMVLANLMPSASLVLSDGIRTSDNTMLRINLMRILSERDDARYLLRQFAEGKDILSAVARFELARSKGGNSAAKATTELIALGHPIVIEYVLNRMRKDVEAKNSGADFYAAPILKYLRSTEPNPRRMTSEHDRLAVAAELLGNLGTPDAMKGLWDILSAPDSTIKKLTAGALYRSNNKAVCDLVRPLLKSAFPELKTYAALLLARNGDRDAIGALLDIQKNSPTHQTDVLTLVNWYLLKLAGKTGPAVRELAKGIK